MRKSPVMFVILAMASPLLGGCQSLFGHSAAVRTTDPGMQQRDSDDYAESQMALGKEGLDTGQYALAIVGFRNARIFPEQAAGAYNGLAIAYLRLDRPDLAERFFKQAIVEAPGDKRYQANLARFYQAVPDVAVRNTRDEGPAQASLAPEQQASAPREIRLMARAGEHRAVTVQGATGQLIRISANQLMIGGRAPGAPPLDARRRSPTAATVAARQPLRRVNPQYPNRFAIVAPAPAQATAGSNYPVRIGFAAGASPVTPTRTNVAVTWARR